MFLIDIFVFFFVAEIALIECCNLPKPFPNKWIRFWPHPPYFALQLEEYSPIETHLINKWNVQVNGLDD